jgi:cysteine-rich repeat protein
MWTFNPETEERTFLQLQGGGHSVERDADGDMWITAPGPEQLIKLDVESGEFTRFDQLGSYPHTLRFDDAGNIWFTLTRSNEVSRFVPSTQEFTYYPLPPADPAVSGIPIPVTYGCDVAPDGSAWWSQLFGHRIGRVDPETGRVDSWRPPIDGPRRLRVGPDGMVWVPGYGSGKIARFDPSNESWKVYTLPIEPLGYDLTYAMAVDWSTGDVWLTGSNSDTMIRFRPDSEEFTVFPLPTAADFTREIEFDDEGNVWTCTSNQTISPEREGTGRLIKIHVRERVGRCGDGSLQLGEACDDGNAVDCDGCSARCELESGCGDRVICGDEECDDGNDLSCDGCFQCGVEAGAICGDGETSFECGEECDPPDDVLCRETCERVAVCGDDFLSRGEECDDGNTADCDGCTGDCRLETGCGDGVSCGAEECDDGNVTSCDGCFECVEEIGSLCGDGIVNDECGEECDPPGGGCSVICSAGDGVLGSRHLTFGGSFFSSSLGVEVSLGDLSGEMDLLGGTLDAAGVAPVEVDGPVYYSAAILGGQFGTYCVRIDSCDGWIDCNGGSPVGVLQVQDSNGPGMNALPGMTETGLGEDAPAGAVLLDCQQTFVQLQPGEGDDCPAAVYPPSVRTVYTSGTAEAFFVNGNPKIGSAAIELSGEPFDCSAWGTTDGPGQLVGTFLVEEDRQAGDLANANRIDD